MTIQNWLTILGMLVTSLGGLYALIRSDINNMMDSKINQLKQDLQNERIGKLEKENEQLRDRVNKTK
jgi:hypothetical protein